MQIREGRKIFWWLFLANTIQWKKKRVYLIQDINKREWNQQTKRLTSSQWNICRQIWAHRMWGLKTRQGKNMQSNAQLEMQTQTDWETDPLQFPGASFGTNIFPPLPHRMDFFSHGLQPSSAASLPFWPSKCQISHYTTNRLSKALFFSLPHSFSLFLFKWSDLSPFLHSETKISLLNASFHLSWRSFFPSSPLITFVFSIYFMLILNYWLCFLRNWCN